MNEAFLSQLIQSPDILMVEKDHNLQFTDCNQAWLVSSGMKKKEYALGSTDRDAIWGEYSEIYAAEDYDIMSDKSYGVIHPCVVESNRFCYLRNFKWPKRDTMGNIIGVNVIAHEVKTEGALEMLSLLEKINRYDTNQFHIGKSMHQHLTPREQEVLFLLCYGITIKMIAALFKISPRTVESHIVNIKTKFNCNTKSQLIEYAVHHGFVTILPNQLLISSLIKALQSS